MTRAKRSKAGNKRQAEEEADESVSLIDESDEELPVKKSRKTASGTAAAKNKAAESTPKKKKAADKLTADDFDVSEVNLNERLTEPLLKLAKEEMDLGNKFKGISIKNAALLLKKYPKVIESGDEAMKLKGVGKSIAKKIDDILANGSIQRSEDNDDNQKKLAAIDALSKIYGVNHTQAASLVRDHNVTGVADLMAKQDLLEKPAKIGLKYFKDFQQPIPREEVEAILDAIRSQAKTIGDVDVREFGAFTRGESPINEMFVLIGAADKLMFTEVVDALQQSGLVTDIISSTDAAIKAVCAAPVASHDRPEANAPAPVPKKVFAIPKFSQIQREVAQAPNLFAQRGADNEKSESKVASRLDGSASTQDKLSYVHRRLEMRYCSKDSLPIAFTQLLGPASFFRQLQAAAQAEGYNLGPKTLREHAPDDQSANKQVPIGTEQELFERLGLPFVAYDERATFRMPEA